MRGIIDLCESKELSYPDLMEAVEEFVNDLMPNATEEVYQVTAKRILGESMSHDDIMIDAPYCKPSDLVVLETNAGTGVFYGITTDTQIKTWLTRLKLGRKGLEKLYKNYQELKKKDPNKTDSYWMGQAGQLSNISPKIATLMLTKLSSRKDLAEYYFNMADTVLIEETPVSITSNTMPDHKPTDGNNQLGDKKVKKRKGDKMKTFEQLTYDLHEECDEKDDKKKPPFDKKDSKDDNEDNDNINKDSE